jgi:predicted ATPase/DNA-binding winged helix-turn-helix (wHTH) protein
MGTQVHITPHIFGPFRLLPAERVLERDGRPLQIGSRAFDLLQVLVENSGMVVSKSELTTRAWPNTIVDEVSLRVHISGLRKTLGTTPNGGQYITNVSGRGYLFSLSATQTSDDPTSDAPVQPISHLDSSLPVRLGRMVGREREVALLQEQLLDRRFVSVVGAGGLGKTTAAVAAAHEAVHEFEHGVYFVDLAPIADSTLVMSTIAALLNTSVPSTNPLPPFLNFLREKRLLLVLDNAEHLVDFIASFTEEIYRSCLAVHILVTSREALRVEGEYVFNLAPLAVPPRSSQMSAREIMSFPAVSLFMDRAHASGVTGQPSDTDAVVAAEICRRLDGVALAIELVAGRAGAHGIGRMLELLDHRFGIHWQGRRTALPRHQTLAALHDWSYNLLGDKEKLVLRQLSCFAGPFALDAAVAVLNEALPVATIIENLCDKSLLSQRISSDGLVRYRLSETTRAYCAERLRELPDEYAVCATAHAVYCAELLERASPPVGSFRMSGITTKRPEILGDVRHALEWAFSHEGNGALGVRLASSAAHAFLELSLLSECYRWASTAIEVLTPEDVGTVREASLNQALAISGIVIADAKSKIPAAFRKALGIATSLGNRRMMLELLAGHNISAMRSGDCYTGAEISEKCEAVVLGMEDAEAVALSHCVRGVSLSYLGDLAAAKTYFEQGCSSDEPLELSLNLVVFTQRIRALVQYAKCLVLTGSGAVGIRLGRRAVSQAASYAHPIPSCIALAYTASALIWKGDWDDALELVDQLADVSERHSLAAFNAVSRGLRGDVAVRRGNQEDGILLIEDALKVMRSENHHHMVVDFMATLAEGLTATGSTEMAKDVLDEAIEIAEKTGEKFQMADMLRLHAVLVHRTEGAGATTTTFPVVERLCQESGALLFELRLALSFVSLPIPTAERVQGVLRIEQIVARFDRSEAYHDLRRAVEVIESAPRSSAHAI